MSARSSSWSSHRFYLGLEPSPPWLDVALGLALCGFSDDRKGREAFDRFVEDECQRAPDPLLDGGRLEETRREARSRLGTAVEISYPRVDLTTGSIEHVPCARPDAALHPTWAGDPTVILGVVAERTAVSAAEIRSCSRVRRTVAARRLVLATGRALGLSLRVLAGAVGISGPAAVQLLHGCRPELLREAEALAAVLRPDGCAGPAAVRTT